jgi:hypothetical protein
MTSGTMNVNSTRAAAFIMLIFLFFSSRAAAEPAYLSIAESIVEEGRNTVMFDEKIVAFYLDEPLLSKGKMHYEPPDKLVKVVEEPEYIKQEIQGGRVVVTRKGKTQSFSLSSHLVLEVMANTLRSLLSGNIAAIENEFSIKVVTDSESWKMVLVPLNEHVLESIESVVIEGKGGVINRYTITEGNGDYAVTSLHDEKNI